MKPICVSENFDAGRTAELVVQIEELVMQAITAETEAETEVRMDEAWCALLAVLARLIVRFHEVETNPSRPDEIVNRTATALSRQIRRELARRAGGGTMMRH
jgi:hypothetical protein